MIYNQGFNMEFADLSFYAFSKYEIRENPGHKNSYNSLCYSTCVGWYRNQNSTKWGCYQAFKLNVDPNQITSYNTKFDSDAVEPEPKEKKPREIKSHEFDNLKINSVYRKNNTPNLNLENNLNKKNNDHGKIDEKSERSNVDLGVKDKKHLRLKEESSLKSMSDSKSTEIDSKIFFRGDEDQYTKSLAESKETKSKEIQKRLKVRKTVNSDSESFYSSFLQYSQIKSNNPQHLNENHYEKSHQSYVEKLNKIDKSWTAAVDPNFAQMSLKELNRFAGGKKSAYNPRIKNNQEKQKQIISEEKEEEDLSMFPKNFDWMSLLRQAGSQGQCGSCYAYATIRMVEARLKLKYKHEVNLSVQHPMDCSIYNQGCEGGYPFLVMKFADEFELLPENCKPYMVNIFCLNFRK